MALESDEIPIVLELRLSNYFDRRRLKDVDKDRLCCNSSSFLTGPKNTKQKIQRKEAGSDSGENGSGGNWRRDGGKGMHRRESFRNVGGQGGSGGSWSQTPLRDFECAFVIVDAGKDHSSKSTLGVSKKRRLTFWNQICTLLEDIPICCPISSRVSVDGNLVCGVPRSCKS